MAPLKFSNGPLAGCNGLGTNTLSGFVTPLLAIYWALQSASTEAGTFCLLWNAALRFCRLVLFDALYPAEANHVLVMAFSTKTFHCLATPFSKWRSNRDSATP